MLAIRDTGTYKVRLEHSGSILWTRSIVEVLHKRTGGGLLDTAIELLKENGPATAGELIHIIRDNGLWKPKRAGSTPRLTLYSMRYNEATKFDGKHRSYIKLFSMIEASLSGLQAGCSKFTPKSPAIHRCAANKLRRP